MNNIYTVAGADAQGQLYQDPGLAAVGRSGEIIRPLPDGEWIPLPVGSSLALLPGRAALGTDKRGRLRRARASTRSGVEGELYAVAALLPMGYVRTYLPAAVAKPEATPLPLFGYTAVCFYRGQLYAAASRVEPDNTSWDPRHYNTPELQVRIAQALRQRPGNRILVHLAHCALRYGCFTAQNIFYGRWEAGVPVSPVCNARCLGCISKQVSQGCPSPQERISFIPSVEEITAVAVPHLVTADDAIISFGQGCEGEPTLMGDLLVQGVEAVRARTAAGLINLNTNGSRPHVIRALARAGLNSIRVSLISPLPEIFNAYVRPWGYSLQEVKETLRIAAGEGLTTSLNYLIFPGVSDREEEVAAVLDLLHRHPVDLVQLRNLNIDPDKYMKIIPPRCGRLLGIRGLCARLQTEFPQMQVGSFTHRAP